MSEIMRTQSVHSSLPIIPMRALICVFSAASVLIPSLSAQQAVVPVRSELQRKRTAHQTAVDDFLKGDPDLEKQLRTAPKDELLKRIDQQQKRVDQFTNTRVDLYQAMRTSLQQHLQGMQQTSKTTPEALRKSIEEGLSAVKEEQDMVDQEIKASKSSSVNAALTKQKEILQKLEFNLLKEDREISKAKSAGTEADAALQQTREGMQALAAELTEAEQRVRAISATYKVYFADLKSTVESRKDEIKNPLAGTWRVEKDFSSVPTKLVQLDFTVVGDQLRGTLTIECTPPPNSKIPSRIKANITDRATSQGPFAILIDETLPASLKLTPQDK